MKSLKNYQVRQSTVENFCGICRYSIFRTVTSWAMKISTRVFPQWWLWERLKISHELLETKGIGLERPVRRQAGLFHYLPQGNRRRVLTIIMWQPYVCCSYKNRHISSERPAVEIRAPFCNIQQSEGQSSRVLKSRYGTKARYLAKLCFTKTIVWDGQGNLNVVS